MLEHLETHSIEKLEEWLNHFYYLLDNQSTALSDCKRASRAIVIIENELKKRKANSSYSNNGKKNLKGLDEFFWD